MKTTTPSRTTRSERITQPVTLALVLVGVILLAYWPAVYADYINYDDPDYVTENPMVLQGLTWGGVKWAFTTAHASNWHPLTWLSHMLDVQLFGPGPRGPHCVNLVLHGLNTLLLFQILRRMSAAKFRSFLVAGLFALHPLHVESVAWVAERKDVLSTLFWMLTLLAYHHYVAAQKSGGPRVNTSYLLALGAFALGLMSKPMLVTLPFVLLMLDFWPLQRIPLIGWRQQKGTLARLMLEKTPFLLLTAASCFVTTKAQEAAMPSLQNLALSDRLTNALVAYIRYLGKTFWPTDLALPYLHPGHWPGLEVAFAALLIGGICAGAILKARQHPYLAVGWFWYLGTLVPVIGIVQVGVQSIADRYTYVPLIGIFIALTWAAGAMAARLRLPLAPSRGLAAAGLIGCLTLTRMQVTHWQNSESLFKHSTNVTRDNYIALSNLGGALFTRGELDQAMGYYRRAILINSNHIDAINSVGAILAAKGSDDAIEWFRRTLALSPTHADALFNMGNAMARRGNSKEAAEYYQQALRIRPDNYEAQNNLGNNLIQQGKIDAAITAYQSALIYRPNASIIHKNLGEALAAKGKLDAAATAFRHALALTNDASTHYSLGLVLAVQGDWSKAINHYRETLRLSPSNAPAHYNLGYALSQTGDRAAATTCYQVAIRLRPVFPLAHYNLGCVLAESGNRAAAILHLREALRQQPDYEDAQSKLRELEIRDE